MRNSVLPGHTFDIVPRVAHVAPATRALASRCDVAAERLRDALGAECEVVVCSPFVLGGDLERPELASLYDQTIAPAVRAMHNCYFEARPTEPVTVLLFRGEESYNRYCDSLFGERGISIYGYYKPRQRTMVLNIATGHGTLLHELTHALVAFDFPDVPDWLNEGLASLHEQSRFQSGARGPWIEGLVNWRLHELQEVARAGKLGSLASLVADSQFRGPREGTNYAQARYFCLYMQQKGVLAEFYRAFKACSADDPSGLATLARVFPGVELPQIDRDFERWVLGLRDE